jgi:hypothetical protein
MRPLILALPLLVLASGARADGPADPVKSAVEKGLARIKTGAANYLTHRQCFSCHHQLMSILSLTSARQRGFTIEPERVAEQVEHTLDYFRPKVKAIALGGDLGGNNETAAQALLALDAAGHPADEVTTALVEFLIRRQIADGAGRSSASALGRLPGRRRTAPPPWPCVVCRCTARRARSRSCAKSRRGRRPWRTPKNGS